MWPADRVHQCNAEVSNVCPRCGLSPETSLHCFWQCPANDNIQDEHITKTQSLAEAAIRQSGQYPCLWLRGILPKGFITIPDEDLPLENSKDTNIITWINQDKANLESGVYYGDASGGEHTLYPDIIRVGCAFVSIDDAGQLVFGAHFPLVGEIQTVYRGELMAWLC